MESAATDASSQPSLHWFAYASPVASIMALTLYLATDATSSLVYTVVSIVTGAIGLIFSYKAGRKAIWPIMWGLVGILFSCYVGWLALALAGAKAAQMTTP